MAPALTNPRREDMDHLNDSDSDLADELNHLSLGESASKQAAEKRRTRQRIFDLFVTKTLIAEAKNPKLKNRREEEGDDELQSVNTLMSRQSAPIINSPRQYQVELFERAQKSNTIAVLDTGSGKTLIAVLLLKWILDQELEHRAQGNHPRVAFFLVPSVQLVYQQHAVLTTNLDHDIDRLSGGDNPQGWKKDHWDALLTKCKVIVCTAEILRGCLTHGFVTMKEINMIIFDEAHHTKKDHPYARIVKDFYISAPKENRPRIFGMTASPIDAKNDIHEGANELEILLHSRIATNLDTAVKKPEELVMSYPPLPLHQPETAFLRAIRSQCQNFDMFNKHFETSKVIARALGTWCADDYLARILSEERIPRYEAEIRNRQKQSGRDGSVATLDKKQSQMRSLIEFTNVEYLKHGGVEDTELSPKVKKLQEFLASAFEMPSSYRCIVFVEFRSTARALSTLFNKIGTQHMRSGHLIGSSGSNSNAVNSTFRDQVMTMIKFRKGDINCLFATSVAEEGLDVPDCNLVVRFDLYKTLIQYVQSRGRARQEISKFIHMIEAQNSIQIERYYDVKDQEGEMRSFCSALPKDRRLDCEDNDDVMGSEKLFPVHVEPSTNAKLTFGNALSKIENFVSAIPNNSDELLHPAYTISSRGQQFIAEIYFPQDAPIKAAVGKLWPRKAHAKQSAAYEACVLLRKLQYLDANLLPIYQKKLPLMRNAMLAVDMHKTDSYAMRVKPTVWENNRGSLPTELWVTIVEFREGLDRPHQPLALLTRTRMPSFPEFPLILMDGRPSTVISYQFDGPIELKDAGVLEKFTVFTFRVFQDVFSKKYEYDPAALSYWLAPAQIQPPSNDQVNDNDYHPRSPVSAIDWNTLDEVTAQESYTWKADMSPECFIGKFLVDKWDGGRKLITSGVSQVYKPDDPVPEDAVKSKWNGTILQSSVSLWKKSRTGKVWDHNQAVMEAEQVVLRRNMLGRPMTKERDSGKKAYVCLEPMKISTLSPRIAESCMAWPAVIHRFEEVMIALELTSLIGVECSPALALEAATKDSDSTGDEFDLQEIHFKPGMGPNYERLEFIGDTFLKTTTTIATFILNPNDHEFEMHVKRMLMLCNKNLFNVAQELKTSEYIRSIEFSRLWYPEGLNLLEGKGMKKRDDDGAITHTLGQKNIADVSEALIGASFVSCDQPGSWEPQHWQNAVQTVTKLVGSPDHTMLEWDDYQKSYMMPAYRLGESTASQREAVAQVATEHPYQFKCPKILRSAFLHPSLPFVYEEIPSYERLEHLGDSLLDLACVTHLFYRYTDKDPQWLTEHKMAMVANKFLGAVCVNLGFHRHIRLFNAKMQTQVTDYATELLEARETSNGAKDYWTTVSDPPKCLPDIVESYVGALFIDSGFNYAEVQKFFDINMKPFFEDMSIYDNFASSHPCTLFHQLLQTTFGCRDYSFMVKEIPTVIESERKDVMAVVIVHNEVIAHSKGKSGRYSKGRAANTAYKKVNGLIATEFRQKYKCDCHLKDGDEEMGGTASDDIGL